MAESDPIKRGFQAVSDLVKTWKVGDYAHHVRYVREKSMQSEFLVIFSLPAPTKPVPEHVAMATFYVRLTDEEGASPKIVYCLETNHQKLDAYKLPIRKFWLDEAIKRKRKVLADSKMFQQEAKLPMPKAFIPGQYKAEALIVDEANNAFLDNQDRLLEATANLGDAQDVALRNAQESVVELENLLVSVFNDADKDGNGVLDKEEFSALLDTANLGLDASEKLQLMMFADLNGDNSIEYAEFAGIGADVIQTMRLRKQAEAGEALLDAKAELEARKTLHSLGVDEVTATLLEAFKQFDSDGSGRLERAEIVSALQALSLGATKLTSREIRMIMSHIDEDGSGTIEYNEFAPLMFNWMVEALKLGFLASETNELQEYMFEHCMSYDASGQGMLDYHTLKRSLMDMDLVQLSPIQMHSLLADVVYDEDDRVALDKWVPGAARLVYSMFDPQLEYKRKTVEKMARITPLQALTDDEKARLAKMTQDVFMVYDADGSGKLDRVEFQKCLTESQMGFTERQIQHMMAAADVSEDGMIDYGEFETLFNTTLLELSRLDAIEKMLAADDATRTLVQEAQILLDELMIPMHIAFDLAAEGTDAVPTDALVALMRTKGPEWELSGETVEALCGAIANEYPSGAPTWKELVALIERMAFQG